jgi:hypothetical protein
MPRCPTCGEPLRSRGIVAAERAGRTATRALADCANGHRFARWTDADELVEWTAEWWPRGGTRPDLEADRPPHWG